MKTTKYSYITLRQRPDIIFDAAKWFSSKWNVSINEYLKCMQDYLDHKTEYGWYLCIFNDQIIAGLGVIENDFHKRKDLSPNICAVYTDEKYRGNGIAGTLLNMAVENLRNKNISPVYLLTDHINFYEKYDWQFMCMVENENEHTQSRMYVHF